VEDGKWKMEDTKDGEWPSSILHPLPVRALRPLQTPLYNLPKTFRFPGSYVKLLNLIEL
jgi:hypothetical protein